MDPVRILRVLWRQRLAVAVGIFLSFVIGILLTFRVSVGPPPTFESRQYLVGVASASVLLDSQKSQVSDLGDPDVAADQIALASRARLLANLLVTSPLREQVAVRSDIHPTRLITKLSSSDPSEALEQPDTVGITIKPDDPAANVLDVTINAQAPIVTFNAQAPSPELAAKLSNAAVAELRRYLDEKASAAGVPDLRKLIMEPLGAAQSSRSMRGPTRLVAFAIASIALAIWCIGILSIEGLARRWRETEFAGEPRRAIDDRGRSEHPVLVSSPPPPTRAVSAKAPRSGDANVERGTRHHASERSGAADRTEPATSRDRIDSPDHPSSSMLA